MPEEQHISAARLGWEGLGTPVGTPGPSRRTGLRVIWERATCRRPVPLGPCLQSPPTAHNYPPRSDSFLTGIFHGNGIHSLRDAGLKMLVKISGELHHTTSLKTFFFCSPAGAEVKDRKQSYPELCPRRGSALVGWTGCRQQHKAALGQRCRTRRQSAAAGTATACQTSLPVLRLQSDSSLRSRLVCHNRLKIGIFKRNPEVRL